MRITAKEARERAQIKCGSESILDAIYRNISEESRYGNYFIEIYHNNVKLLDFTKGMIDSLISDKEVQDRVISDLTNLGYIVKINKYSIIVSWE